MKKIYICALVILFLPIVTTAQSTKSIFGFEFGKPIDLPECKFKISSERKLYDLVTKFTCIEEPTPLNGYPIPIRKIYFPPDESPSIVKNWRIFPLEANGLLIGIHFLTPAPDGQAVVLYQLKEKFGEPAKLEKRTVQNAMGASFESISADWKLDNLEVSFEGTKEKITFGEVFIDSIEAIKLRAEWTQKIRSQQKKL